MNARRAWGSVALAVAIATGACGRKEPASTAAQPPVADAARAEPTVCDVLARTDDGAARFAPFLPLERGGLLVVVRNDHGQIAQLASERGMVGVEVHPCPPAAVAWIPGVTKDGAEQLEKDMRAADSGYDVAELFALRPVPPPPKPKKHPDPPAP